MNEEEYMKGVYICGFLGFGVIWLYAIAQWGLLLGLIFGWIPALIGGVILGYLWPLVALAGGIIFLMIKSS